MLAVTTILFLRHGEGNDIGILWVRFHMAKSGHNARTGGRAGKRQHDDLFSAGKKQMYSFLIPSTEIRRSDPFLKENRNSQSREHVYFECRSFQTHVDIGQ